MPGEDSMTTPCEQKDTISEIWNAVDALTKSSTKVETSVELIVTEFRNFSQDLRASLGDGREMQAKMEVLTRDLNIAFGEIRTIRVDLQAAIDKNRDNIDILRRDEIGPLKTWQNKVDGSLNTFKGIQIVIAIVTGILAIAAIAR